MTLHQEHPGNTPTRPGEVREDELDRQRRQLIDDLACLVYQDTQVMANGGKVER